MAKPFPFTEMSGPLAPHAAAFKQWLVAQGFTPGSAYLRMLQFAHLSCWLEQQGLCPDELTPQRGEQFVAAFRAAGYTHWTAPSRQGPSSGAIPAAQAHSPMPWKRSPSCTSWQ